MGYYVGLDMGTSSLGWAVTDEQYNLIRKRGKDLWGVRLFDEASTSAECRTNRVARRRLTREKARLGYVREIFGEAIAQKDAGFFQRLDDSRFYEEDKTEQQPFALFSDCRYTDKDYYRQYPTVFHLRKELIQSTEPHDVRLVYLAVANMFKHRGHFLNANLGTDGLGNLQNIYEPFRESVLDVLELEFPGLTDDKWLEEVLSSARLSNSRKVEEIIRQLEINKRKEKSKTEIWKLICGLKGTLSTVFENEHWEEEDKKFSLSFSDKNFEEAIKKAESLLKPESYELLLSMKQIHDWGILKKTMKGESGTYSYLSFARVDAYEKHKKDLRILKDLYKENAPEKYDDMFRVMCANNYSAYVGSVNSDKHPKRRGGKCDTELFFKELKKLVGSFPHSEAQQYVMEELDKGTFLPKQLTSSNGVIPNQIHKAELKKILENASGYLEFLQEKDESGLTAAERLVKMFEFQIPYYIGPIAPTTDGKYNSKNTWSVRREAGRVLPWNIEEKINVKQSAENFISRMVKHCTYLSGENVLPKNSLIYEKFMVLNELNNLRINGERISVELKQKIFEELLKTEKRVTNAKLVAYLRMNGYVEPKDRPEISGIDGGFTNCRANYVKFTKIFQTEILTYDQEKIAEKIIFWSTVYGDTKKFLKAKIMEEYGSVLNKQQIQRILGFKWNDWGRLSKSLLELEGVDKETGEISTVIRRMWEENYNLMELIASERFSYRGEIEERTRILEKTLEEIEYNDLSELYISAPVRRMIWQTILVLREIVGTMGEEPSRIFVEMARDPKAEKKRTTSRKKKFEDLYRKCKDEGRNWSEEISKRDESEFRIKKLYLYYTQKGKCMYTGESIDLEQLFNDNLYDIDHIYPRHFVKDDSIENNLVLVKKEVNAHKSDSFPLEKQIQIGRSGLWRELYAGEFISKEKYSRLTRIDPFTEEEKAAFISRQLVETRQGTKVISELFTQTFPKGEIVYVKAGNVSDFRKRFGFLKCREINDFHHAQDAYLNIVVGNVYHVKFTRNPYNFIQENLRNPDKNPYHMDKIFDYRVERHGETAWETKGAESIARVKKVMSKNTPLVTRRNYETHGGFADQTIYSAQAAKKANGQGYMPVKSSDERLKDVTRYGGFTKVSGAYFCLVEHTVKNKRVRTIEAVPVYLQAKLTTKEKLEAYFRENKEFLYIDPDVRLERIKMASLIRVNGFDLYLTGRTGQRLFVSNAVQMKLPRDLSDYVRILVKVAERNYSEEELNRSKLVTKEQNCLLYSVLKEKYKSGVYSRRPNAVGENLELWQEKFESIPISQQIYVLRQILKLSTQANQGVDMSYIGGSSRTGVLRINKRISGQEEFKLIHQSATGLYRREVDLLTV